MMNYDIPIELLTDEERLLLDEIPEEGFLVDFQKWASKKTDAPHYTLQSAGLMALSLAAGDTVVMKGIFSETPIHMNLYILIVGPSTTMRKTTVLNYIRGILPRNKQTHLEYITFLDDVSTQALNRALADAGANERPVILNVDEVAGLFETVKRKNSFLSGFEKIVLAAYDHTPISIHRTSAKIDVPKGAFLNVFAASTPEPLMEVLSQEDMESGLLPRLLIFDARDTLRGNRRSLMERMEATEEWLEEKEELSEFLYDIAKHRADGVPEAADAEQNPIFPKTVLDYEYDALVRLDIWDREFHKDARTDPSEIGAMKGRAFWHIVKLAGLFALSRAGRDATVTKVDCLRAALLVETTLADLLKMQEEVGANEMERMVNDVMQVLAASKTGRIKQSVVARKHKLTSRQVRDLAQTMAVRDLIEVESDKSAGVYWRMA